MPARERRAPRRTVRRRRWSSIERELRRAGGPLIAGVDEVGRGSLAGPVVACAVVMPPWARALRGVDDSKQLTPAARERLARRILERAVAIGIGAASVAEIDRLNIYHATTLAMRRALARLRVEPDHILVDGRPIRSLDVPHMAVVRGDARCFNVACASIVAKVTRDRLMARLASHYPEYRWERNCGYGTRDHATGLGARGLSPHHRRAFVTAWLRMGAPLTDAQERDLRADETHDLAGNHLAASLVDQPSGIGPERPPDSGWIRLGDGGASQSSAFTAEALTLPECHGGASDA